MKRSVILICLFALFSCQSKLSQETIDKIKEKKTFWQTRTDLINKNKNTIEYPIKKDTTIGNEKRYNYIYTHSADCQFEIYIDDVLLTNFKGEMAREGGITGGHITNFLLLTSGTHEIKVRMYPPYGKDVFKIGAAVGLTFQHYRDGDFRTTVYDEKMRGEDGIILDHYDKQWVSDKGEYGTPSWVEAHYEPKTPLPLKGLPIYEWRSTFDADVPYDLTGWRNSVNLQKEQEDEKKNIKAELIAEYKKVHEIIKNRDVEGYLKLVKDREELLGKTMYYTEKERKEKIKMAEELLNNSDYELEPLFEETFKLEYQGYGKLVTLLHLADGEGIIRLTNKKDPNENIYLDFLFQRKEKGGKLSVI
ncbi:hypothetical protein SGQ44_02760 [Flavobacterium sp. Fl-77]|uniref:PA14 domain-containing protein n=1 Tax=Flavobacterium flavipigmentatum TaxID=2893884 RepID=A0AAJ2SA62_9FLAO|nr:MULTISPECIES: hypothetical protein [unclassified Flavobacterium]MDX6181060.1 hypothetical protein [Flavobacterium sp. Fl-33]MDX6184661.1 hypothetical protein [Flavobacterium sp. Fl-77]UFH39763.1 hypothetical protein LNP22_05655 [Flavobacterium sp. F-70]